jgi:hypothetical protein
MSLVRTALRLCAIGAWTGTADARPTIAEERVYDSRIGDLSPETFGEDAKPVIIALTDNDQGDELSRQNGGPPFIRMIDLVVEFGMVMTLKDGADFVIGYPDTDARLEASLDLLEFQIVRRLAYGLDPLSIQFRKMARIVKYENHRHVMDDSGVKIACRVLTLTCQCNDDQVDTYNASCAVPSGSAALPQSLREVCALLPSGSAGAQACTAIAVAIDPLTAPAFKGMDVEYDANSLSDGDPSVQGTIELPQS